MVDNENFVELNKKRIHVISTFLVYRCKKDLIEYSKYVASSVETQCMCVFCQKSYQWPDRMGPKCQKFKIIVTNSLQVLQIYKIIREILSLTVKD